MQAIKEAFNKNVNNLKKKSTPEVAQAVKDLLNQKRQFEQDRVELAKASEKKAWHTVKAFAVIAVLSIIAVVGLTPLKTVVPVMIVVDKFTGETRVVENIADAKEISYGDVLDKYWVKKFIHSYNSYNWLTIQSDYDAVEMMSSPEVLKRYEGIIRGEQSPIAVFGDQAHIQIEVSSVRFLPRSEKDNMIAQVSFKRSIINSSGKESANYKPTNWEATLTFDYLMEGIDTEEEQEINPLNFRATSYREDIVNL